MKTCETCKANKVCDHNRFGFENCGNYIAEDVVPRAMIAEIFEEIEKRIASLEYRANTPRKTVKVEELKAQCDWILHEVIPKTLAELRKKYTEENK